MEHGHDDFRRRHTLFVRVDRNPSAIVDHRYRFVSVDDHAHLGAVSGQGFVDGVVHHLEYHVMETGAVVGIADVHARPLANGVEPFQYLDRRGVVPARFLIMLHRGHWALSLLWATLVSKS
jgi:hypothetical protein